MPAETELYSSAYVMKRITLLLAAMFACFVISSKSTTAPPPLIGMGDSLGEGVQSLDASQRTQPFGYLNLIAQQMQASFPLPLIQSGPAGSIFSVTNRTRVDPTVLGSDLGVAGATVHSLLNDAATTPVTTETDLVLEPRTGTQIQIAQSVQSPFTICWIGANDVLPAITTWWDLDGSQMTSVDSFTADYAQLTGALSSWGGKVVVGNIPDVTQIGFLLGPQDLVNFVGSSFTLPQGSYTTVPVMLLIKMGIADGSILKLPNFVLSASEAATISQRVQQFNQIIATDAAAAGIAVTDIASAFAAERSAPPTIDGTTIASTYEGGFFTLDGMHPSNIGYALVANAFIQTANTAYTMQIPVINPVQKAAIALADPFVDWDGSLVVRGRPLAGLLETLGPALGISGNYANIPGSAKAPPSSKINKALGQAFMQQYFALKGLPANTPWGLNDAIAAMKEVFQ